jgi:pimeloyl-ACP methyl ester carboxylesterase
MNLSTSTPSAGRASRRTPTWRRWIGLLVAPAMALSSAVYLAPAPAAAAAKVPNVAALAGDLAKQKLTWETCDFGDPALNERFNVPNVSCATVVVPRDWQHADNGKTWNIRISHAKNIDPSNARYQGTIFANPGGPGGEGLVWGPAMQERTPDLNPYYNYVGFDPRGVGQSSHASCDYEWDAASTDPYAELKAAGKACSANEDVKTINTEQTTYDMDFIRHLLKAPKLDYIGYSYGTWLGTWYENVFGAKYGGRFLLDSSIDSTQATLEGTWNLQPVARDRQFSMHMINWIARHDDTYGLGEDPYKIKERYFAATAKLDPFVITLVWVLFGGAGAFGTNADYPLAGDVVQTLIEFGESEDAAVKADASNPAVTADAVLAKIAETKAGAEQKRVVQARSDVKPLIKIATKQETKKKAARSATAVQKGTFSDPFDMIRCNDGQWTQGSAYWESHNVKQAKKAPLSNQWGLLDVPLCAFWRTSNLMPVADAKTFPATIVLQGEMDSQTGWEGGYTAGTKLPNTSFIAIDNEGSHGHFPYGTEQVDRPVINYFLKGKQPKDITVGQALPLPEDEQAYQSWAKLNSKAKHTGGTVTSPWVPATSDKKIAANDAGADLLADAAAAEVLRQQVYQVYGTAGVKALQATGTL